MSHWCCATASHCNAPFPAPATQSHAPTLPGCFNHLPPNVTLVLRLPHNVTLQRTCNVPFPAPATQSHAPTLPGCFNRLRLPPNVTLVLRLPHNVTIQRTIPCTSHTDPRCNWKCHVHKRANFTCTSEPISRVQANPRPKGEANLTKYCACHEKSHCKISKKYLQCRDNWSRSMIREWSENETISPQSASQPRWRFELTMSIFFEKYNISRSGYHSNFHPEKWHFNDTWTSPKLTELVLDWTVILLNYYLTELLPDWTISWLN